MKRKLALLLAGVMTVSMLPMNLFAATSNVITDYVPNAAKYTVLAQPNSPLDVSLTKINGDDVSWVQKGANLSIKMGSNSQSKIGDTFQVELTNAEWFFRSDIAAPTGKTAGDLLLAHAGTIDATGAAIKALVSAGAVGKVVDTAKFAEVVALGGTLGLPAATGLATYQTSTGVWYAPNVANEFNGYLGVYVGVSSGGTTLDDVKYIMGLRADKKTMDVVFLTDGFGPDSKVIIPLPIRTTAANANVTASIKYSTSAVDNQTLVIISGATGGTTATIKSKESGRDRIELEAITIRESRSGVVGTAGQFDVVAPEGFEFVASSTGALTSFYGSSSTDVYFTNNPRDYFSIAGFSWPTTVDAYFSENLRTFTVSVSGLGTTTNLIGDLIVKNLIIKPTSKNSTKFGDLDMKVKNHGLGITDQTITAAAERVDYGIALHATDAKDTVPTLYTGRFPSTFDDDTEQIQTLSVTLEELAVNSWWTKRDTVLTVPEWVKIRGVYFTDLNNTEDIQDEHMYTNDKDRYLEVKDNTVTFTTDMTIDDPTDLLSFEFNLYVSVSNEHAGDDITLGVRSAGAAYNVDAYEVEPIVIAHTVAPVTVSTKTTDIKIGLQPQTTSDITIKETYAGALLESKYVNLALTDMYGSNAGNELTFAAGVGTKATVTEGDIELKNFEAGTGGSATGSIFSSVGNNMSFQVKSESSKASTIVISNVMVRANRILSETDKAAYRVYIYGTAVGENYNSTSSAPDNTFSSLGAAGVYADYITIAGTANLAWAEFKLPVSDDASSYFVNGIEFPLGDDMKAYNKNGTVYVSLRLLGEALLGTDSVHWNESNRTVVLDLTLLSKATFKIGETHMTVGGIQVDMYDDAGNLVAAEITNDRSFVPLRQVAYALGIPSSNILWDQTTQTVTLNPAK